MSSETAPRYQIGLSLSGAVSAGAYSAGVLDFLLQALDAWEAQAGSENVPAIGVGLKVMAGASAGAITAAIAAISLAGDPESAAFPPGAVPAGSQRFRYRFRRLHEAWVVRPTLVAADGANDLLGLSDLAAGDVRSVLNADLLQEIADTALRFETAAAPKRATVASSLHIYFTLSNLRGTPYEVAFTGGVYGMMQHGDRAHFVLTGLGDWQTESAFADRDSAAPPLPAASLPDPASHDAWQAYGHAALASAAFPVGLAPRVIQTEIAAYTQRAWPIDNWQSLSGVTPHFAPAWQAAHAAGFAYTAVDGGLIDNDPFEYAFYTVQGDPAKERRALADADRGVIMIAPFPEPPAFPADGLPGTSLISAYLALLPALKQQVRFKPQTLALAGDDHVGSRYMISPSRQVQGIEPDGTVAEFDARYPIASGLLNGFGGFVAEIFREHDFQLGRRNCQRFLQTTFLLPEQNPVLRASFANVVDKASHQHPDFPGLPLIPLVGEAADPVASPVWPRITEADLDRILARLRTRLTAVARGLLSGRFWQLLKPVAWVLIRWPGGGYIRRIFLADLVRRDLIADWMLPADWSPSGLNAAETLAFEQNTRAVLAALLTPGPRLRSEADLALACDLPLATLAPILQRCEAAEGKRYRIWRSPRTDGPLFCLYTDRPVWPWAR